MACGRYVWPPPAFAEVWRRGPQQPSGRTALGRVGETRQTVHIADVTTEPAYLEGEPIFVAAVNLGRFRTILTIPMLNENELIGAFAIYRQEVRPFSDKQIELVSNFAAQAVIAIENTRLLTELRESLQQQTATAEVLKVISRSAVDLKSVLDTLVRSAAQLCGAEMASVTRPNESRTVHYHAAAFGFSPEWFEYMQSYPLVPERGTVIGRTLLEGRAIHIHDILADPEYTAAKAQQLSGMRTVMGIPLIQEGVTAGVFLIARRAPQPFSDKQIKLAMTFADQALIAIENARLFDEVQKRTEDLAESLQQQTATANVLKTISRSTFDLKAVLETLVESAARLCDAEKSIITRQIAGVFYRAQSYGFSREFVEAVMDVPVLPERGSVTGRALLEGGLVHIADVHKDPEYTFADALKFGEFRTILGVPMLRNGQPIGVLSLTRSDVRPFTDKQIELVTTLADQAAIAIENVRLFESVESRTRELASRWRNCGPRRTGWFRPRSSPRSVN